MGSRHMEKMKFWLEKKDCSGCGACVSPCPKNAIKLVKDECGFYYPEINDDCINCGLCKTTCLRISETNNYQDNLNTYAAWSKDANNRFVSTSGGMFYEFAKKIISDGGVVAGAKYDENNMVIHSLATSLEEVEALRQSKYTQSNTLLIYRDIKKHLLEGKKVLFCGAPCQVAGLRAYLNKDYEKLYLLDFICRGVNSPKAYEMWLKEIEKKEGSKIVKVWFKYKEHGWNKSPTCTKVTFENGKEKVLFQDENTFMCGYLQSNLYIRPSCGNCSFKGLPRQGDITLGDFWGIEKAYDDDKGTSMVLINNERGQFLFDSVRCNLEYHQRDFSEIGKGNVCFSGSVKINPESEKFLKSITPKNFSKLVRKQTRPSFFRRCLRKAKMLIMGKRAS